MQSADAGDSVIVITNQTPFYAESGGQVGDTGVLAGNGVRLAVEDTRSSPASSMATSAPCPKAA